MSGTLRRSAIVLGITSVIFVLAAWSPVFGDDDEVERKLDALTRRIAALEKALGPRAGDASKPPITDRVGTLEKGLGELSQAAGKPRWSSPGSNLRELKRSLATAERQRNDIAGRLSQLEHELRDAANAARELRNVRTLLDEVRRTLRDLESRVRRLESRP